MWGVPNLFNLSCVVVAMKVLWEAAKAWKAWTETRRAWMNASGEIWVGGKSGGSSRSGKVRSGSAGLNGDLAGEAKSISKGEMCPMESCGTEL